MNNFNIFGNFRRKQQGGGGGGSDFDNGLYDRLTLKPRLAFSPFYQLNSAITNCAEIERDSDQGIKLVPFCNGIAQLNSIDTFLGVNGGRIKKLFGQGQYRYNASQATETSRPLWWDGSTQAYREDSIGNYAALGSASVGPETGVGVSSTEDALRDLRTVDPCFGLGIDQPYNFFFVFEVVDLPPAGGSVNLLSHNFQSNCPGVQPMLHNTSGTHQFVCRVDDGPNVGFIRVDTGRDFQVGEVIVWEGTILPAAASGNTTGSSFTISGSVFGSRTTYSDGALTAGGAGNIAQGSDRVKFLVTRVAGAQHKLGLFVDFVGTLSAGDKSAMRGWIDATFFGASPSDVTEYTQSCTAPIADNQELLDWLTEVGNHTGTAPTVGNQSKLNFLFQDMKNFNLIVADLINVWVGAMDGDLVAREVGLTNPTGAKLSVSLASSSTAGFVTADPADVIATPVVPNTIGVNDFCVMVLVSGDMTQSGCLFGAKDGNGVFSLYTTPTGIQYQTHDAASNAVSGVLAEGVTYVGRYGAFDALAYNNAEVKSTTSDATTGAPQVVLNVSSMNNNGVAEDKWNGTIKAIAIFRGSYLAKAPLLAAALSEYITDYES